MHQGTKYSFARLVFSVGATLGLLLTPLGVEAQGHGGGGGGGESGCGDVFGDLIHIQRHPQTGQPILLKKWIEYPQDLYDWGYCPIPIDANGQELDLAPLSCDVVDPTAVVEVDYFGRLSAGRTKERNHRMHFDEVIVGIKEAERVRQDQSGRLELGTECFTNAAGNIRCAVWRVIDSPMENLAMYVRLMKYGHIQTDPNEINIWAAGDPALGDQYHPALDATDYLKFGGGVQHLLPTSGTQAERAAACFPNASFDPNCALPEIVRNRDLIRASSWLGAAAGKEGIITENLLQYVNRILKITEETEASLATRETLPALIRDCGDDPDQPLPTEQCTVLPASSDMPWPANERFVDFHRANYDRPQWRDRQMLLIKPIAANLFMTERIQLINWVRYINGPDPQGGIVDIDAFVLSASDALRINQLIHEYSVPADLGWNFQ